MNRTERDLSTYTDTQNLSFVRAWLATRETKKLWKEAYRRAKTMAVTGTTVITEDLDSLKTTEDTRFHTKGEDGVHFTNSWIVKKDANQPISFTLVIDLEEADRILQTTYNFAENVGDTNIHNYHTSLPLYTAKPILEAFLTSQPNIKLNREYKTKTLQEYRYALNARANSAHWIKSPSVPSTLPFKV